MNKIQDKNLITDRKIAKSLLALGFGGFVALYFTYLSRTRLISLSKNIEIVIKKSIIQDIEIDKIEILIILCSIFSLLTVPFFIHNKKVGRKILLLLILLCGDVIGVMAVVVAGKIFPFYTLILWISSVYVLWLILELLDTVCRHIKKYNVES